MEKPITRERLTPRQRDTFNAIKKLCARGYPPTSAEIASEIGVKSQNAVRGFMSELVRKGFIVRTPGIARGIKVTAG